MKKDKRTKRRKRLQRKKRQQSSLHKKKELKERSRKMTKKRLYDRDDIAKATVEELAQMERRAFILSVSLIQIGIQQIWDDNEISNEVASEIIMPLFSVFNESHPYEEVGYEDTLEVIKVMKITYGTEE